MSKSDQTEAPEVLNVADIREALHREIREVMKDAQLRIQELSKLTTDFAAGDINAEQATELFFRYKDKWGDPLPGVFRSTANVSDEVILADMEKAAGPHVTREEKQRRYKSGLQPQGRTPG